MPTHIWIDTDAGIDDVHALMLAVRHPECRVEGISLVRGNVVGAALTPPVCCFAGGEGACRRATPGPRPQQIRECLATFENSCSHA